MERIGKHKCEAQTGGEMEGEIEVERKMERDSSERGIGKRRWKEEREATEQIAESCTATSCLAKT